MTKKHPSAFSLIELSIVILVIGLLIGGMTQSSRLIYGFKVRTGQTLTQSSGVNSIPGITTWLETTADGNITSSTNGSEPNDGDKISLWRDSNPQTNPRVDLAQSTDDNRPTYLAIGINGMPSLNFDGSDDFLANSTTLPIAASDDTYTIVAVWKYANSASSAARMVVSQGGDTTDSHSLGSIQVKADDYLGFYGNDNNFYLSSTISKGTPYITILKVNNDVSNNITIYQNSNTAVTGTTGGGGDLGAGTYSDLAIMTTQFVIGAHSVSNTMPFAGLVSEIIVFDRALKYSEITDINSYLSKKYNIILN